VFIVVYQFTAILSGHEQMTQEMAEALYVAGCDDGHPWSSEGLAAVTFDREAADLGEAIRSALADVRRAGFQVTEVRLESEALAALTIA
jgi:hypothetical protein